MKKHAMLLSLIFLLFVGGCSFLTDVNNTLTYVDEATEYANEASAFANEAPSLAEQAINDQQALEEFETRLKEMKQDIEEFNELEAPEVGADLHQQIVKNNNKATDAIDLFLTNIQDGQLDPSLLENTEAFQSLNEITSIINEIKQLRE
ncbi:DUF6376 family protein [Pseudalkalibacillus hwajinpoensis]|uniref:DUF6376 family protein n=1 Tax=Guptibacillus hwajinpoensis TaxID=208199 RepID=UPI00325A6ED7